jgi:uncharacterized protein (TIGR04255 family)
MGTITVEAIMYAGREVFPNPPLEYVAAEVRYPYAPRLRQQEVRDAILMELEDIFPILRPLLTVTGTIGGSVSQQIDQVTRAFNRPNTAGVSVTASALIVDTTAYEEFPAFQAMVGQCVSALDKHASPAAIERVGLRYVNEVRVPAVIGDVRDWRGWISDTLVGAAATVPDRKAAGLQGMIQYESGENRSLMLRFAAVPDGSVIGNEPLIRRNPGANGPFFALDLDSFWQPPTGEPPEWSVDTITSALDQLHAPVGSAFQGAITDKLRDELLRRDNGH